FSRAQVEVQLVARVCGRKGGSDLMRDRDRAVLVDSSARELVLQRACRQWLHQRVGGAVFERVEIIDLAQGRRLDRARGSCLIEKLRYHLGDRLQVGM